MDDTTEAVRSLLERWVPVASAILEDAVNLLDRGSIHIGSGGLAQPKVFAAALLARTIGNLKSVVILAQHGMVVEARTLTRCCFENVLWLHGIAADGEDFVRKILDDERAHNISFSKVVLPIADTLDEDDQRLVQTMAALKRGKAISRSDFKDEEAQGDYMIFRMLSGDSAHPSAKSLSFHLSEFKETGVAEFHVEPVQTLKSTQDVLEYASIALVKAMVLYDAISPRPEAGEFIASASKFVLSMPMPVKGD